MRKVLLGILAAAGVSLLAVQPARADRLCDPAGEDCRAILLNLIQKETAGIDLMWGNVEAQYDEAVATINDNGGILGRQIDPVYVYVDPLSETGYLLPGCHVGRPYAGPAS